MDVDKVSGIHYVGPIDDDFSNTLMSCLLDLKETGAGRVVLYLSSTGGSLAAAYTAYNYLKTSPFQVDVVNTGSVESAAVYLYLAGENRYYFPESRFMIHPPLWTFESKTVNYPTLRDALLCLEQIRRDCNKIFLDRTSAAAAPLDIEKYTTAQSITLTGSGIVASGIGTALLPFDRIYSLAATHRRLFLRHVTGETISSFQK
jgi:ATP-dependent protease ClpP protease subunit